jgi:hypothetical protein
MALQIARAVRVFLLDKRTLTDCASHPAVLELDRQLGDAQVATKAPL